MVIDKCIAARLYVIYGPFGGIAPTWSDLDSHWRVDSLYKRPHLYNKFASLHFILRVLSQLSEISKN